MPIKVTCQCGKSFAAKDELAGKTVKCPGCQKPIKIPSSSAAPAPASQKPAQKAAAAKPAAPAPPPAHVNDDLFDEIGLQPQEANAHPCPGCGSALPENAVVCIRCGYNLKLGRRMETIKTGGEHAEGGHGAIATDLLGRAAQVIDEDKAEEKKKTTQGMPWWAYLIILLVVGGFLAYMIWRANQAEEKPKEGAAQIHLPLPLGEGRDKGALLTRRASESDRPHNIRRASTNSTQHGMHS